MAESEFDEFGKRKIYPSNTDPKRAKPWLLGKDDWEDRIEQIEDYTPINENSELILNFKKSSGKGRNYVVAIPPVRLHGNPMSVATDTDQRILRKRGYMGTPADWKNVEITIYARINNVDFTQALPRLSLAARGYHHHSSNIFDECEGTAYYTVLKVDGSIALQKELFHRQALIGDPPGYSEEELGKTYIGSVVDPLQNPGGLPDPPRWIGMKGIFYNNSNGNPKMELWLDKEANNDWGTGPVIAIEDKIENQVNGRPGWSIREGGENYCDGEPNEPITWGGPAIILRWDALTDIDIKWTSVREIVPPEMSLHNLFKMKEISFPADIRSVAEDYGLVAPISARALAQRLL
jgi:hypothetical protein